MRKKKLVSSANMVKFKIFEVRSLTYIRKRSGPSIDPCGTPQVILACNAELLLKLINCLRLFK